MSEPPPEPNTEFDFREPPMTQEGGEEADDEGGMSAGEDAPVEPSAGVMTEGGAGPDPKDEGCDQSSSVSGDRSAHLMGIMLLGLLVIRRRRRAV